MPFKTRGVNYSKQTFKPLATDFQENCWQTKLMSKRDNKLGGFQVEVALNVYQESKV